MQLNKRSLHQDVKKPCIQIWVKKDDLCSIFFYTPDTNFFQDTNLCVHFQSLGLGVSCESPTCIWFPSVAYVPPSNSLPCLFPNLGLCLPFAQLQTSLVCLGENLSLEYVFGHWGGVDIMVALKLFLVFFRPRKPKRKTRNTSLGIENRVSKVTLSWVWVFEGIVFN